MQTSSKVLSYLTGAFATVLLAGLSSTAANAAGCTGAGAPSTTQTKCIKAITIPNVNILSFDISWVNPARHQYYLGDRSTGAIDIIDTKSLTYAGSIFGFVGVKRNGSGAIDNNHSGPDGVTSHGRWLYAGDGDSTLKVIDLDTTSNNAIQQTISTGGTTRLDEMALNTEGTVLIAANNAEDPPFATMFAANGDNATSNVKITGKIVIQNSVLPAGFGLSIEQPAFDFGTQRFFTAIPIVNNPAGCNYGQLPGPITCDGGVLVTDPKNPDLAPGLYNPATNTGVVLLRACGPNGATRGPEAAMMFGCTTANNPSNTQTLIMNSFVKSQTHIDGIVGSDEVYYNPGDGRYYLAASRMTGGPVLGVVDTNGLFIEKIPTSSGSHSVAADPEHNYIFVPQVAPVATVGVGGDTTTNGAGICGGNTGCIAVYQNTNTPAGAAVNIQ